MQNISLAQRAWLMRGGHITPSITVDLLSGQAISIADEDIKENSLKIDRNSASGKQFEIGSAETTEISFSLLNQSGKYNGLKFEGALITVTFDVNGEPLPGGVYTIDEKPQSDVIMKIRALDKMARFNKLYDSPLVYPATLQTILTDACTRCGVSLYSSTFPNHTYLITVHPDADATYHQVIGWVAQIAGSNAFINVDGLLEIKGYSGTAETIPDTAIFDFEFAESDIVITGVKYEDEDNIYLSGTDSYTVDVSGNPFIHGNIATAIGLINTQINGFTYRPITKLSCVAFPHLWPMDKIAVVDNSVTYQSIITSHNISTASEIKAVGEPEIVKGYAGAGLLTPHQKNIIKALAKEIAQTKTSALEIELLALNEQITNSLGYYTTIITNEDGSQKIYHHDKVTLEESMYIDVKPSAGSFAWTTTGWNNGNPVWQYGVTQSGSLVMRLISTVGLNADWINAGTIDASKINVINLDASSITTGTINGVRISSGAITADKIAAGAVTADKLGVDSISSSNIIDGTIGAGKIASGAITADKIATGAILANKLNLDIHLIF